MKLDLEQVIKIGCERAMEQYELTIGMTLKEAVEKQIPKKPIDYRFPWSICPNCNGSVYLKHIQEHIGNEETTYCEHCGQALDWSDSE